MIGCPFDEAGYAEINRARLEHLGSLGLPLSGRTVLEVGAGRGDLTPWLLARCAAVTVTDARRESVDAARARLSDREWPGTLVCCRVADVEDEDEGIGPGLWDVVLCYGLLYHLAAPGAALERMAAACSGMLLLETCVYPDDRSGVRLLHLPEDQADPRNSVRGLGCRPSRDWAWGALTSLFEHVYATVAQPDHPEFPLDWSRPLGPGNHRAVFVASRAPLDLPTLTAGLPITHPAPGRVIHQADPNG